MTAISSPRDNNRIPAIIGVSSTDGVTPVLPWVDPTTHRLLVDIPGGVVIEIDTATPINGVTTAFVFASKPVYLVSDGVKYRENHGWTWNAGTTTATLSVPPTYDLWGEA